MRIRVDFIVCPASADLRRDPVIVATLVIILGAVIVGCVVYLCVRICLWYTDIRDISVLISQLDPVK